MNRTPPINRGGVCSTAIKYFPVGKEDPIKIVVNNMADKKIRFDLFFMTTPLKDIKDIFCLLFYSF